MKLKSLIILVAGVIFLVGGCQFSGEQRVGGDSDLAVGLLQHNVYFYFTDDISPEEISGFEAGLKKLLSIDEVYKYEIGIPGPTENREVTDHSFGFSFFSWFQTMEDYEVYAVHPVHLDFIEEFNHLWADVKVYDSKIIGEKGEEEL